MALKKTTMARRKGATNARKGIDTAKKHGIITGGRKNPIRSVRTVNAVRNSERLQWFEERHADKSIDKIIDKVKVYRHPDNK